jgi:hypothetical protein
MIIRRRIQVDRTYDAWPRQPMVAAQETPVKIQVSQEVIHLDSIDEMEHFD